MTCLVLDSVTRNYYTINQLEKIRDRRKEKNNYWFKTDKKSTGERVKKVATYNY